MSDIKHHLTDSLLMAYASGNLNEAFSLVVATHVSLCDECRARLEGFEAVGGVLIDDPADVQMRAGSFEATLALIERGYNESPIRVPAPADAVFPAPLRDYVNGDVDAVRWKSLGGGVKQAVLETSQEASVRLLSIPGGVAMPDHGHSGTEMTMVLQGAYADEDGRYARGDVEVAGEDLHHTPIAEPGETCICLAATDAPLRFTGWLPRIAQPFLGI
ncbi:MAG: ChrR family anti-sigma-E factor [Pseudomonadota bacterium]